MTWWWPFHATVKIVFMGLVALVPKCVPSAANSCAENAATILLPDAVHPGYSSDGCPITRHVPVLAVQARSCWEIVYGRVVECQGWSIANLREPVVSYPGMQGETKVAGSWSLERQQIELVLPSGSSLSLANPPEELKDFPTDETAKSWRWIPVPPTHADVRPECLIGSDCPIVARVALHHGTLETCHFAQLAVSSEESTYGAVPRLVPFRFGELDWPKFWTWMHSPFKSSSIADAFSVDTKILAGPIMIELRSLDTPTATHRVFLWPSPKEEVRIWIANVPDPDAAHGLGRCHRPDVDSHFEAYYGLTDLGAADRPDLDNRRVPQCSGAAMPMTKYQAENLESFQSACPLLVWGVPPGNGPVGGDKPACGQFQAKPSELAGSPARK